MMDPATSATRPGYSAKCRACNSAHRAEVDARLLAGESTRAVSAWLSETHGERIPHQGLLNHRGEHLNARAEAAAIVEAATPVFVAAVERIVADTVVLDDVASIALDAARSLLPIIKSGKPPMAVSVAFTGALSNARAAVTDRHEMLHGKKLEVTGVGAPQTEDVEDLHRRAAAALAALPGGADPGTVGSAPGDVPG